jgi:hypothetical protein
MKTVPPEPPPIPRARLSLGLTGHRDANSAFLANKADIAAVLDTIFDLIAAAVASAGATVDTAPPRLHTLLSDGADQLAAHGAITRGWELVAPLPFGRRLNAAINAQPRTPQDARALLAGRPAADPGTEARARAIYELSDAARLFELSERDALIADIWLANLDAPQDSTALQVFDAAASARVELAARVMIEQSDLLIAIWDGAERFFVGGTGHTIAVAVDLGAPVIWIDARAPQDWRFLQAPEALHARPNDAAPQLAREATLAALVRAALLPDGGDAEKDGRKGSSDGVRSLSADAWRARSHPLSHAYRRIEALFGGGPKPLRRLRQTYERPDAVSAGSGAAVLAALQALPGADPAIADAIEARALRRFAWADGISSRLSDVYRGGMTASFLLSASAIVAGVLYLPFGSGAQKGPFAAAEFLLLAAILAITSLGQRERWHDRWLETRRVAEYLRHSSVLLALGVARPPGRWPRGSQTSWPEWYARHTLREVGLPRVAVTSAYLRAALEGLLDRHVIAQRDYHAAKARRLTAVHRNLDWLSETSFVLAVISVALFLLLLIGGATGFVTSEGLAHASKWFTLLSVILPALGAAVSGIRYFGDFERFAAISEVTAEKLDGVHQRIDLLSAAADTLDYDRISDLVHAADDIVVTEIERWQSVFGGKHITVPV